MSDHHDPSPVNSIPPVIIVIALVLVGVEGLFQLAEIGILGQGAGIGWRLTAVEEYGFYGQIVDLMIGRGDFQADFLMRFVTYIFVQRAFLDMIFVGVFLLAMGKFVAEVFDPWAVVAVFVVSGAGGALAYGLILNDPRPLIGGFPAIYGLIGAYTFILWRISAAVGVSQIGAFRLIAILLGIQLVFTALFGGSNDWVADLGGFATGFGLSFLVSPGGWQRLTNRTRNR